MSAPRFGGLPCEKSGCASRVCATFRFDSEEVLHQEPSALSVGEAPLLPLVLLVPTDSGASSARAKNDGCVGTECGFVGMDSSGSAALKLTDAAAVAGEGTLDVNEGKSDAVESGSLLRVGVSATGAIPAVGGSAKAVTSGDGAMTTLRDGCARLALDCAACERSCDCESRANIDMSLLCTLGATLLSWLLGNDSSECSSGRNEAAGSAAALS
jgi:hypothetical protein